MSRFRDKMTRFGKSFSAKRSQAEMANKQDELYKAHTPQDVANTRAKSQRHGKSTADKWNQ